MPDCCNHFTIGHGEGWVDGKLAHSSGHLHPQSLARPLVDVVRDGDGGGHLAEVGDDAAVQPDEALGPPNVPEEAEHVRLLRGQVEILAGLALQLGADEGQRVGGNLAAAAAEGPEGEEGDRGQRRVPRYRVLRQVFPLQSLQIEFHSIFISRYRRVFLLIQKV